jgi:hypothetical protein
METQPDSAHSLEKREHVAKEKRERAALDAAKRWFGIGAAVLSFGSAVYGTLEYQAENRQRAGAVAELLATSRTEQAAGDYPAAWKSMELATRALDAGLLVKLLGGSSKEQVQVRTSQEDLAMQWLRDTKDGEHWDPRENTDHYSNIADPVLGVLSTGANGASGTRKADLLAHIGLAYDLKQDDQVKGLHPDTFYREAVEVDPTNPYANTFWGYWIMGQTHLAPEGVAQAQQRFAAALSSSKVQGLLRQWVRQRQFRSITSIRGWWQYAAATGAFWHAVDEMYKGREPFEDRHLLEDMRDQYTGGGLSDFESNLKGVLTFVPIAEHLELMRMLVGKTDPNAGGLRNSKLYLQVALAMALEKAGKADESLATWRDAKAALDAGVPGKGDFGEPVDTAIKRLSAAGAKHS